MSKNEAKFKSKPVKPDDQDCSDKLVSNPAWADAIAKILKQKKSPNKKSIVLSKAKKIQDVKEKKPEPEFEIVNIKAEVVGDDEDEKESITEKKLFMKECLAKGRVKPSILEKDRERMLQKIATRGVVQLFNAVRQQQKTVEKTLKKAGKSEHKREKLLESIDKKKFLDAIQTSVKSFPLNDKIKSEEEDTDAEEKNTWSVLRNNFMMGTKLRNWDKLEDIDGNT